MFRNSDKGALKMTAKNEASEKKIAELEDKLAAKKIIIDDLMYTAKNDRLEHEFELKNLRADNEIDQKVQDLKWDKKTQENFVNDILGTKKAAAELVKTKMEYDNKVKQLKDSIAELTDAKEWEIEKARNEVRKDLKSKCIEADLRAITAKARADAAEVILDGYKAMIAGNKSNVAEKALNEALKVIGKAVEFREVHVTNKAEMINE